MNILLRFLSYAGDWLHSQLRWGLLNFLKDPDTRCILHLISRLGTVLCTMHLALHVLILLHDDLTTSSLSLNAFALL